MGLTLETVFLSSTAKDLSAHREAVFQRLRKTNVFHVVRQEDFGPEDSNAQDYCREMVEQADILVGIVGLRRGWEPAGDSTHRSITEMEHDWAREQGLRRHIWVAPDDFPVPGHLRESDDEYQRQCAFRNHIRGGGERIVSEKGFGSPADLASEVVEFLLARKVAQLQIAAGKPRLGEKVNESLREEQEVKVAAAIDRLAEAGEIDLLAEARSERALDHTQIEARLEAKAEELEARAQRILQEAAEYWRHIGSIGFLHNSQKALKSYNMAVKLDPGNLDGMRFLGELQYRLVFQL